MYERKYYKNPGDGAAMIVIGSYIPDGAEEITESEFIKISDPKGMLLPEGAKLDGSEIFLV